MCSSESDEEEDIEELYERATQGEVDLDETMASADESSTDDDMCSSDSDEEEDIEVLYERTPQGEIDLDEIMVSAAHAGKRKGGNPTHLSKILKILEKTAEGTLSVVSQSSKWTDGVPRWIVELGRVDTEMVRVRHLALDRAGV
jgi:hypothetical protein